jgi:uncharacterized membrane protein YqgA involved in biofilm formation
MSPHLPTAMFVLFVVSAGISGVWLYQLIQVLARSGRVSEDMLEGLNQLLLSGSGGMGLQWQALSWLVARKYLALNDENISRAGNRALAGSFSTVAFLLLWCVVTIA